MFSFNFSPKSYSDMLPTLNITTFFTTLFFSIILVLSGYIPHIKVNTNIIPPLNDHKEMLEWILSFGILPFSIALFSLFLSWAFEMHNKVSRRLYIRYLWDRVFIVQPLLKKANFSMVLTPNSVDKIMKDFYFPEVKNIDQHYVHLFWHYALIFWIFFEHLIIVFLFLAIVPIFLHQFNLWLLLWFFIVLFLTTVNLFFIVGPKSTDQANQIPIDNILAYFRQN